MNASREIRSFGLTFQAMCNRLAVQLRLVALLDRGIKRVHIDGDDFSQSGSAKHTSLLSGSM